MKLIKMIPDPVSQPEAFDPGYPADWMKRDIESMSKDNPWLNLCNLAQCVFVHRKDGKSAPVKGATMTFVTPAGSVTVDSLDLAVWWLMCADGWRVEPKPIIDTKLP